MRRQFLIPLVGAFALLGAAGCATKGYVKTAVADGTAPVERRLTTVEAGLEDTVAGTARNAARIREVGLQRRSGDAARRVGATLSAPAAPAPAAQDEHHRVRRRAAGCAQRLPRGSGQEPSGGGSRAGIGTRA